MAGHIQTADRTDWCTPPHVVAVARGTLGGIAFDPCSNVSSVVGAAAEVWHPASGDWGARYGLRNRCVHLDDGLQIPWRDEWFCNPPFGRALPGWVEKARWEHERHARSGCLLLPANVDTKPWHEHILGSAAAVGLFRGRLTFLGAPAPAPMPCALVYYGNKPALFELMFEAHGKVVRL